MPTGPACTASRSWTERATRSTGWPPPAERTPNPDDGSERSPALALGAQEPSLHELKGRMCMNQTVDPTPSPTRLPHQPMGLLWAYLGLTFALAWAAWVPAAVFFANTDRPGLPSFAGGLFVLQTLGVAAPT